MNDQIDNTFAGLFKNSMSGAGEEELLNIASKYSRQLSSKQIKSLIFLEVLSIFSEEPQKTFIRTFIGRWLDLKQYNGSALYVMRALDSVSLRRFINENSLKINVDKK